jgi:hypothetical protein
VEVVETSIGGCKKRRFFPLFSVVSVERRCGGEIDDGTVLFKKQAEAGEAWGEKKTESKSTTSARFSPPFPLFFPLFLPTFSRQRHSHHPLRDRAHPRTGAQVVVVVVVFRLGAVGFCRVGKALVSLRVVQ